MVAERRIDGTFRVLTSEPVLRLPYGLLLAFSWLPLLANRLRAEEQRRQRLRRGQCLNCGYDLRATKGRCPECGEPK